MPRVTKTMQVRDPRLIGQGDRTNEIGKVAHNWAINHIKESDNFWNLVDEIHPDLDSKNRKYNYNPKTCQISWDEWEEDDKDE